MENTQREQQETFPDLDIALELPIPDSPPNELNLALPDSDDEYALAENKNSNSEISQLYDSISDDSPINEDIYVSETEGVKLERRKSKKDVSLTRYDILDVDIDPIDDETPEHDKLPEKEDKNDGNSEVEDQLKAKGKSLVKKSDKLAKGDKYKDSKSSLRKGVQPKEKGDQVPKKKQNETEEFEPQPSTSHGEPTLSHNAEPFTPIGQRLLDEIVRILPDFPYRLLDAILDDRRRRNTQDDDDDSDSFSLPSPTSSIRIQSNVKVDFLGNPRFVPIRQNNNQSRSDTVVPYQNPQDNYTENPRANYLANYVYYPSNYVQDPQQVYQAPEVEYVNVQSAQNLNFIPFYPNIPFPNVLQYTGTHNFDNPPGYQQDEISETFYELPTNVQPLNTNEVYQYQYMPEGYDAYYPCMDNVDPVFIPQPDYLQPQPLVGPSCCQFPNVYTSGVHQPLMPPYFSPAYVPQVNMGPYYAQENHPVLFQQMAPNVSPRYSVQRSPRPQSRSPRRARGADPNFVPSARAGTRQSRPRQRSRPQTPPRPYWATKIRLPTVPYRPFWYPRKRSPEPLMKPTSTNHNPAMLPIYKTMQLNGLGMVIPPRSSHELTNEIISPILSPRQNRSPDLLPRNRSVQRSLPSRSPQISTSESPQTMSPPLSPRMAPFIGARKILHRQPEFEERNRLFANRNVNRVIRSPRKCRIERLKHNASYGRSLRYRHLLDDDEVDLLENLDLGQVRNVDTGVQALDLEEYLLVANISVVHHVEHRSDTDLTTFTCRESSEFLSTVQRNDTYDLQTLTRKNSSGKKSHANVKSVAVLTDTLQTRTIKTQTDVLDVKIPFKTIIPTKFKVRKNPIKSSLKSRSASKSNKKSVTFSVKASHSLTTTPRGKKYIKLFESLEMSTTDFDTKIQSIKLLNNDTVAQPLYTVFNKPATELKSPRLVSIENIPSTSHSCRVEISEDDTPNKILTEIVDYETPGQSIPSVAQVAPKKVDKFVSLKRNIPFQDLSKINISGEKKIVSSQAYRQKSNKNTRGNNEPVPSTSGYQRPQRFRGPEEVKRAPKPQRVVSILERVPSMERILYCKALNMDETPTTTPVNKIPFQEPTAPKLNKIVKKITTLARLPRMETLPNNGFAIYVDPDPEEDLSSSPEYNTPVQPIPEVGTLAPRLKRTVRLREPSITGTLVYDTPGPSKDAPIVEIEELSKTEHKTPIMQKNPAIEVSSTKQQRVAKIDGASVSVTLVYDTPGSSKDDYTTPVTQKMPEVVAMAPKRQRVTKIAVPTKGTALIYDTPKTVNPDDRQLEKEDLLPSEEQENVADSIKDPEPSTSSAQLPEFDPQPGTSRDNTSPKYETFSWAEDCESLDIQPGTGRWQDPEEPAAKPEEPDEIPDDFDVPPAPRRRHPQLGTPSHISYAQVVGDSPQKKVIAQPPRPTQNRQLPEPDYRRTTILELTLNQRLQPNSLQKHFESYMNRGMNIKSIGKDVILLIFREPGDAREMLYKKCALGSLVTMEHASQRSRDVATRYRISLRRKQTRTGRRFISGHD